jgi:hypothetical protein
MSPRTPSPKPVARHRSVRLERGYTVIELLMAVCIFGFGVMGVIAMQKVTSSSNRHAKSLATGTHVAQSWVEHLAVDATRWNQSLSLAGNTVWLSSPVNWSLPAYSATEDFGPAFDALGQPLADAEQAVFCTHIRVVPLISELNSPGNGLLRVDVRVFWPRDGEVQDAKYCTAAVNATTDIGQHPEKYHFVYKSTAVRQTSN